MFDRLLILLRFGSARNKIFLMGLLCVLVPLYYTN